MLQAKQRTGAILTTCHAKGCHRKTTGGDWYCDSCKIGGDRQTKIHTPPEKARGRDDTEATRLRSTLAWAKFSRYILRNQPWCADPFKAHTTPTPARHVHHIIGVAVAPDLLLEPTNVSPLCISCHARIESLHRNGYDTTKYFPTTSQHTT